MTQIKSSARIDELFSKALTDGISHDEKKELILLLKKSGLKIVKCDPEEDNGNVH